MSQESRTNQYKIEDQLFFLVDWNNFLLFVENVCHTKYNISFRICYLLSHDVYFPLESSRISSRTEKARYVLGWSAWRAKEEVLEAIFSNDLFD